MCDDYSDLRVDIVEKYIDRAKWKADERKERKFTMRINGKYTELDLYSTYDDGWIVQVTVHIESSSGVEYMDKQIFGNDYDEALDYFNQLHKNWFEGKYDII